MPGKIKVKVLAGRNLPVMDRASDTTDAFVEIKFGNVTHKTDVCRKTLNPHWNNAEWYRFEVDESELQDEPLQLRLMDHDTYSANDAIGKVVISLAPLLAREANNAKGAGPPGGSSVPPGYKATAIHGFVEELVVNDDPEYQWIDKIRTPRASNEARQVAFIKLSNQVQRLVGLKAAELGANAVVGYQQDFDLEGEAGVVARAIATDNESVVDLNQYFQSHHRELQRLLNIMNPKTPDILDDPDNLEDDDKNDFSSQSSVKCYTTGWYQDDYVSQKSLKHISEDQTDLNKLLRRNDDSDSDSAGPIKKIKKIKSHFTKRLGSLRSRKPDKQDDNISLQSNSSDNSRISLTDFKNEFKKFKSLKKPKFRKAFNNSEDDGIGMASILARSVIHAHTSLACIAEKESEHSPCSTMRRTSESEPNINVSDDEHISNKNDDDVTRQEHKVKVPDIHTSLKNVNADSVETTTRQRKISESCPATPLVERSENLLKLPEKSAYFGSVSLSGDSSDVYSSSDEDDDSSENADGDKSVETTSSVVQSVLNKNVDPAIIAHMERKLSILESGVPELKESQSHGLFDNFRDLESREGIGKSKSSPCIKENELNEKENTQHKDTSLPTSTNKDPMNSNIPKSNKSNHHFKFHNPFTHKKVSKSMSAPSSPVENKSFIYRSSKKIKRQLSNISKSISHYSLSSKKAVKVTLSQPGSITDVPSKIPSHETVLGSPFLSYVDLMSLDKEGPDDTRKKSIQPNDQLNQSKVTMYIGSEPVSRASLSGPSSLYHEGFNNDQKFKKENTLTKQTGLVHTAMETILIDKVQSLLVPATPEISQSKEQKFFDDVNEKLGKVEESRNQISKYDHKDVKSMTLTHRNVNKAHFSLPATPCVTYGIENKFFDDQHIGKITRERKEKQDSLIQTAMKTMLIEKVNYLAPVTAENMILQEYNNENETIRRHENLQGKHNDKKHSLIHTAMETILIDKVQALLPTSAEPIDTDDEHLDVSHQDNESVKKRHEKTSLLHSAMETMLLEKAQALIPASSEPVTPDITFSNTGRMSRNSPEFYVHHSRENTEKKNSQSSLLHSAMETILMDKLQTLIPSDPEPSSFDSPFDASQISQSNLRVKDAKKSLFHSAMGTMLLDNVQTLMPSSSEIESLSNNHLKKSEAKENINTSDTALNANTVNLKNIKGNKDDSSQICESISNQSTTTNSEPMNEFQTETSLSNEGKKATNVSYNTMNDISEVESRMIINAHDLKEKKLVRQDSVHSLQDDLESQKMSKETSANLIVPSRVAQTKPVLQHFHPILSGKPLETIPSLPESSLDHSESLDIDGVQPTFDSQSQTSQCKECDSGTNSASVCGNSHAACDVDRNEREKEKSCEKEKEKEKGSPRHARHESYGGLDPILTPQPIQNSSFTPSTPVGIHRRSSDSDLSVTPKDLVPGGSLNASLGNAGSGGGAILRPSMNSSNIEMLEYPFLTMTEYPPGLIMHLGGTVCARSVKLVDAGGESAARAAWWAELRTELRAHARALRCNAVIAYTENAAICEDVCVLSASGTAAVINLDCDFTNELDIAASLVTNGCKDDDPSDPEQCTIAHVPYSPGAGPYRAELSNCGGCKKARVPAVLLATCEKPKRLTAYSKAVTVTAVAARIRRAPPAAEPGARDISDQLPFLEYELHKLLLAKLRMQGANALFSLQTQIAIGERCVMALASGTAVRLVALPPPTPPRIKASENDKDALDIQRALWDSFSANKAANGYDIGGSADAIVPNGSGAPVLPDLEADDAPALDLCTDKDACVLELDEAEDVETAKTLATRRTHMPVFTNSLKTEKRAPPQLFAQVWRARLALTLQGGGGGAAAAGERHVARALDGVAYKLRRLTPCALVRPHFHLELPEDEIQLVVSGSAIPLEDPDKSEQQTLPEMYFNQSNESPQQLSFGNAYNLGSNGGGSDNEDDIFALDEDQLVKTPPPPVDNDDKSLVIFNNGQVPTSVSLTSLGFVSGSRAERRICALRLLFVRETTAVRELGGLSGFLHTFTCEVLAIARAYTAALGGNALTSFYIKQLMLQDNAHKNQGQCLLSVGGDVVHITY